MEITCGHHCGKLVIALRLASGSVCRRKHNVIPQNIIRNVTARAVYPDMLFFLAFNHSNRRSLTPADAMSYDDVTWADYPGHRAPYSCRRDRTSSQTKKRKTLILSIFVRHFFACEMQKLETAVTEVTEWLELHRNNYICVILLGLNSVDIFWKDSWIKNTWIKMRKCICNMWTKHEEMKYKTQCITQCNATLT